jgi:type I restriction enzyme S subunit
MSDPDEIPDGWQFLPLEKAMDAIIDYRGKSPEKQTFGVPLITAKVIKGGRIIEPDEFIREADYDDWMRRGLPLPGDVVLTTEAPLGEVAQLDNRKVALAQRVITLRGKHGVLDNTFLKFLLQSARVQSELQARATGTTVVGIKQSELRKVSLLLPTFDEQRAIARVLGDLDDKIELNRRMNATLEAMAQALFRSWFVDFDPVRAKAEGRAPEGMDAATAALFPDTLVDSEFGEIPEGWRPGNFGEIAENPRRTVDPEDIAGSTAYIALEHMPRHSIALSDWEIAENLGSGKFRFYRGEILFGKLRPYFHKVGVAPIDGVCSTDILVLRPQRPAWFGFLLGHASSEAFVSHTNAGSTGTRMPRTGWSEMAKYSLILPPANVAESFTSRIEKLIEMIGVQIHENRRLTALRDELLPQLLSGELRIPEPAEVATP